MVGLASAENQTARIKDAIKESNWEALERGLDRLKQLFFDSVVFGDRQVATFIGKSIAEARQELLLSERVRPELNAEAMSWVLASDSATCETGLRMFRPESRAYAPVPDNVEKQVLKRLYDSERALSTGQLAEEIDCARETVSRALTGLRDRSFVRTVPVGRTRLHYITRRGQLHLIGSHGSQAPVPSLIKPSIPKDVLNQRAEPGIFAALRQEPPPAYALNEHQPEELETANGVPCSNCLAFSTSEKVTEHAIREEQVILPALEMAA